VLDVYLLGILFAVGLIAAYDDIRKGKVRNRLILAGLLAGGLGYLWLAVQAILFPPAQYAHFKEFLINISFSWLLSFFIWYAGLWSAGDAKIFMLFTFLFPLNCYGSRWAIPLFPAANLLANTFILILLFVISEIVFKTFKFGLEVFLDSLDHHQEARKRMPFWKWKNALNRIKQNRRFYFKITLVYFCFFLLLDITRQYAQGLPILGNFSYIVMLLAFRPLRRIFEKIRLTGLYLALGAILIYKLFFLHAGLKDFFIHLAVMLRDYGIFMGVFYIIFMIIESYLKRKEEVKISSEDLSVNMVLSHESANVIGQYLKREGSEEKFYADGLTSRQVERIKEISSKNNFDDIRIYKTFPFVPFVFLGAIVTVAARGIVLDMGTLTSAFKMLFGRIL